MNKNHLWVAALALVVVVVGAAACDETIGDCYPIGQTTGSGDPGVGATGTTGSGNPGEGLGQAQSALTMAQCNGSDQGAPPSSPPPLPPPNPFAGVDQATFDRETLRATALADYLYAMVSSSNVDPNDDAAFAALVAQDAPVADAAVTQWLTPIDPSTIPTYTPVVKPQCNLDYGCPVQVTCAPNSFTRPSTAHACWVVGCGDAKCTSCPDSFPDFLKSLVCKSWCAYVCVGKNVSPPPVVALGGSVIRSNGTPWPSADTTFCYGP